VLRRCAVQVAVEGDAAEVQMQVVLPRDADAAVQLGALLQDLAGVVAEVRRGCAHDLGRFGIVVLHRLHRELGDAVTALDPHLHVGDAVLDRLVRRQRSPERAAIAEVLEGELEHAVERTDGLRALQHDRVVQLAFDGAGRAADLAGLQPELVQNYVTAMIGEQLFGLPIDRVQDVFTPDRLTAVPLAPPEVAGVLNLRGRIATAIDMRCKLGLPTGERKSTMAVGIEYNEEFFALLIDRIGEVVELAPASREPNPRNLDPRWARVSQGVHRLEHHLLVILDVDRLLALGSDGA
jgi:purine-binding chemotaxis protein CheW